MENKRIFTAETVIGTSVRLLLLLFFSLDFGGKLVASPPAVQDPAATATHVYFVSVCTHASCAQDEEAKRREYHREILADIYRSMQSITYKTVWAKVRNAMCYASLSS